MFMCSVELKRVELSSVVIVTTQEKIIFTTKYVLLSIRKKRITLKPPARCSRDSLLQFLVGGAL